MNQIKRSDEILRRGTNENRGLTKTERGELREAYLWEQQQAESLKNKILTTQKNFKAENEQLPRHIMYNKCSSFLECPLDFKCRNYNPTYVKCVNCPLHETDGICKKTELHNERNITMMVSRSKIEVESNA